MQLTDRDGVFSNRQAGGVDLDMEKSEAPRLAARRPQAARVAVVEDGLRGAFYSS